MSREWEDHVRDQERAARGEVAQANLKAILEDHGCETLGQLARNAYKYTDCGAWLAVRLDNGAEVREVHGSGLAALPADAPVIALLLGSIVEGVDQGTETVEVNLLHEAFETPEMAVAAYGRALEEVEKQAGQIWKDTHGCPTCAHHFGYVAANGIEECEGDDGLTPIWDECPDCHGHGTVI